MTIITMGRGVRWESASIVRKLSTTATVTRRAAMNRTSPTSEAMSRSHQKARTPLIHAHTGLVLAG